ncbi:MAG: hypothetical protein K1X54_12395 [Flavobacteriales bacterium]|nr:hypothetical protein [Flavobacteriales bacterium]
MEFCRIITVFTCLVLIMANDAFGQNSDSINVAVQDSIVEGDDLGLDSPIDYYGKDSTVVDVVHERIHLYGAAWVKYGDMEVQADYIQFSFADFTAKAIGKRDSTGTVVEKASFTEGENKFSEDSLAYNFKSKRGISYGVRTQEGDAYLLSSVSKKAENNWVSVGKGKLTTCNKDNPHYHFQLKKAMVIPNEKVVAGPLYLKFRKIPTPLALPFGFFPNKKESTQGILLPGYGNGNEKGYFIQNLGYYVPLGKYADTRLMFDLYTRGSWSVRNVTNYRKLYKYNGSFNISRTVNKNGFPELPSYNESVNFNVQWTHNQDPKARPNSTFSSSVNLGSLNNFRNNLNTSQESFLSSTFSSRIQWTKRWADTPFNMGVTAGHSQNTQSRNVQVTLPALNFNMSRITLGRFAKNSPTLKKTLDNIGLTASADFTNSVSENETMFRFDEIENLNRRATNGLRLQGQASSSLKAGVVGTLTGSISGTMFNTFKYVDKSFDDVAQTLRSDTLFGWRQALNWSASGNFNTRVYGTFNFGNNSAIKAIRHVLQWNVGASYSPYANFSTGIFDQDGDFIGYSPFDVAAYRPSDSREQLNLNWSSTNNFEAKIRDKKSAKPTYNKVKLIDSWKKSLSYNTLADSLNLSNLNMSAFTTIAKNITLNYSSTYSFYDRDTNGREINEFLVKSRNQLMRMEGTNLALGFRLQSKNKSEPERADKELTPEEKDLIEKNKNEMVDFSIPWNLTLNYNLRFTKNFDREMQMDTLAIKQAFTFTGDMTIFKYWKVSFNSGYDMSHPRYQTLQFSDFGLRDFTTTNLGLHWDLHCWEFSASYVPFGQRKSYMVQLNIKSALLQDLKIQRRGNLGDQGYLY